MLFKLPNGNNELLKFMFTIIAPNLCKNVYDVPAKATCNRSYISSLSSFKEGKGIFPSREVKF
jgi:hypothetical protein